MRLLSVLFAVAGTFLLAPHLLPAHALERIASAVSATEGTLASQFSRLRAAVRGYPDKQGFRDAVEPFATTAALSILVVLGYVWVHWLEPRLVPGTLVLPARLVLGALVYVGFYASLHFWAGVLIDHKPLLTRRLLYYLPLLVFGTVPAALGLAAMQLVVFASILLTAGLLVPVILALRSQLAVARWGARQKPDRLLGYLGLALIAAAAAIAAWGT